MTVELEHIQERVSKKGETEYTAKITGTDPNGVNITITLKSSDRGYIEEIVALGQSLTYEMKLNVVEPGE